MCVILQFAAAIFIMMELLEARAEVFNLPWHLHLFRLGVVVVLHNKIEPATDRSTKMIKITALNIDQFDRPYLAFSIVVLQFLLTISIEAINLWYLLSQTTVMNILWGYLAFAAVLTFDEAYFIPYLDSELNIFRGLRNYRGRFRKDKIIISKEF